MATDKTHKIPNAPNLRFPEFSGTLEEHKIAEVAPLQRGFDLPTQEIRKGEFPVVYSNGILRCHKHYKCEAPGLITGRSGTIGKFTFVENGKYWPHNTSLWVTDFCGNHPQYVYYLFQTINIEQYATGSGVPTLNRNDVHRHTVFVPSVDEQKKIAEFLSIVDERIATQIGAISKQESLIKGLASELTCEGEKVRIADLVDCHSSTMQENDITNDGHYPVYGATGICGYTNSPMCNEDAIIIVKDGSGVGNIKYAYGGFSILGTLCYLTAKQDVSIGFVYCCLINFDFSPYKTGMAIPHIYFKDYGKGKINIKNVAEQQKTKTLLFLLMEKLDVERKLLAQYKLQKQYLLSQMFI